MSPGLDDGVSQGPLLGSRVPADADSSRSTMASRAGEFYASPAPLPPILLPGLPPVEEGGAQLVDGQGPL